jgi:DNA ligase (NAD+)
MREKTTNEKLEELYRCENAYYSEAANSPLSDREYDALKDEVMETLKVAYPDHPYLRRVGAAIPNNSHWTKRAHRFPIGSLNKCNEYLDFVKWWNKHPGDKIAQDKLDGISIDLEYEEGQLIAATTRGEGDIGEDIFRNVVQMRYVPLVTDRDEPVNIRSEILLFHNDFSRLKDDREFKNPRNACSGIAKRISGVNSSFLTVVSYDIINMREAGFVTELEAVQFMEDAGFKVVNYELLKTPQEALNMYNSYCDTDRAALNWDIDGLVFKTNKWQDPGEHWDHPKNKIAWKFPNQYADTVILGTENEMSGGHITPVALLEPTDLCGVTISRASLHNYPLAISKGIGVGAKVEISRRNDVIPHVESVLIPGESVLTIPTSCPKCSGNVAFEQNTQGEEMAFLICLNPLCAAKAERAILSWLRIHKTKGIGPALVQAILDEGLVTDLNSFLRMATDEDKLYRLSQMDGMGKGKVRIFRKEVLSTHKTDLKKALIGLDFARFSKGSTEKVMKHLLKTRERVSLRDVFKFAQTDDVNNVEGFGKEKAANMQAQFKLKEHLIDELLSIVEVEPAVALQSKGGVSLEGQSFCFTGALEHVKRNQAQDLVKALGGSVRGVSKNLTYLVTNNPDSSTGKAKKARDLGTSVINEEAFLEMIEYSAESKVDSTPQIENNLTQDVVEDILGF